MLSQFIILRYVIIIYMMVFSNVTNVINNYKYLFVITLSNLIILITWPQEMKEINLISSNIILGYSVSITFNSIGVYMCLILDVLIWISLLYERYYILNKNLYNILLLYLVNGIFFSCNDMLTLGLFYEFQNIPLLMIINNIYSSINMYNKKGIGISNNLLMLYSIISGLLLYGCLYSLYLIHNNYCLIYVISILSNCSSCISSVSFYDLCLIMLVLLISGSIKLSLFPFHIWLGKVHVEAPTIGSIILAGIALKTGFYLHYLFINFFVYIYNNIVFVVQYILILGLILLSLTIFYQIDMKRWIALYSIVHMNLYYIFLLVIIYNSTWFTSYAYLLFIVVLIYGMIGHSLISSGLFLIVGYIYDISGNKNLMNVNMNVVSSVLSGVFFLLILANSSFPFFILFVFELLALSLSSMYNILLLMLLLIISFSNLLSGLYIRCKYMFSHYYQTVIYNSSMDMIVVISSVPLMVFIVFMGISMLLPLRYNLFIINLWCILV